MKKIMVLTMSLSLFFIFSARCEDGETQNGVIHKLHIKNDSGALCIEGTAISSNARCVQRFSANWPIDSSHRMVPDALDKTYCNGAEADGIINVHCPASGDYQSSMTQFRCHSGGDRDIHGHDVAFALCQSGGGMRGL